MFLKNILLVFLFLIVQQSAFTQDNSPTTQMGSKISSGSFIFSSLRGERYTGSDDKKITQLGAAFDYLIFFGDRLAAGPKAAIRYQKESNFTQYTWTLGPKAAYYFDNGSNTIPYIATSLGYLVHKFKYSSSDKFKAEGLQGDLSGGLAIRRGHLLILLEAGYTYQKAKNDNNNETESNALFYLSIGFGASLY